MKPVFGDEKRESSSSSGDATTVSKKKYVDIDKPSSMALGDVVTRQQAEDMALKAAEIATEKALTKRKEESKEDEDTGSIISSKTVKELQNIAGVFNALKDFSANPLQKAIEGKVGDMAAGVVERAFGVSHQEQKKDLLDQILNSQFAAGLGAGLGQRGPELVDTFTKNFGKEKVDGWISGAVNKRGGTGSGIGGIPGIPPPGGPGGIGGVGGIGQKQSEIETVLGLDPNNSEHVAAYADSQGGMSVETARKVLIIHQDDFIKQLDLKGVNTTEYKLRRNQQIPNPSKMYRENLHGNESYSRAGGVGGVGGIENVQEYRGPPPRINDDLMTNTPITEDKKWEKESETQNIELHPEMERVESVTDNPGAGTEAGTEAGNVDIREIANYLKNLNDYMVGIKDEMSSLRQEVDVLKRDRTLPDDMIKDRNNNQIDESKGKEEGKDNQTTVRSMRTIKKGFSHIKEGKTEG